MIKRKGIVLLYLILLISFSFSAFSALKINEVMYAPPADLGGSKNEWVEIYNDGENNFNFSECTFEGKSLSAESQVLNVSSYLILTPNKTLLEEYYNFNDDNYYYEKHPQILEISFGRGLSDAGKNLF